MSESAVAPPRRWMLAVAALALAAIVLGVRAETVGRFGTDLPMWDQWDAEAETLFRPWLEGNLRIGHFFIPHNEHTIAPSKALALLLLAVNGQWDSRLECIANAALHALIAAVAFVWGARRVGAGARVFWFVVVAVLAAPPIAWHNVISGFHTPQYFLLLFALCGMGWLLTCPAFSPGWWGGIACTALAVVSLGSGLFTPLTIAGLLLWDGPLRDVIRRHAITLALCAVLVVIGVLIRVEVPAHEPLRAKSMTDFLLTFWRNLQWPAVHAPWFGVLAWCPWVALAWRCRLRTRTGTTERVLLAAGGWVLLQYLAAAYARGAGGPWPAPRYLDTVQAGIGLNAFTILWWFAQPTRTRWLRPTLGVATLLTLVAFVPGWWSALRYAWNIELTNLRVTLERRENNTRAYLATNDRQWLKNVDEIAYPNADALVARLEIKGLRQRMPVSVRQPLPFEPAEGVGETFRRGGIPPELTPAAAYESWGSFDAPERARTGTWESTILPAPTFPYWTFRTVGSGGTFSLVGKEGVQLAILAAAPSDDSAWHTRIVEAPEAPVRFVARDVSEEHWFAFQAPVEMARLSRWAAGIARSGAGIAIGGSLAALCVLAIAGTMPARSRRAPTPTEATT